MSPSQRISDALTELNLALDRNQADLDYTQAVVARGGEDGRSMLSKLADLEAERGRLLDARHALLAADAALHQA